MRLIIAGAALVAALAGGCALAAEDDPQIVVEGGDVTRGAALTDSYGCGGCHQIPGVDHADGVVGPPLDDFGDRATIGGHLANEPNQLVRWLLDPGAVDPGVDMPDLGLTEEDARDIAAFLLELG